MPRGVVFLLSIIGILIVAGAIVFHVARTNDGPMEIISGGPFQSGELITGNTDWSFLEEQMTIEMQTMSPPSSRTMWVVVVNNRVFVISSYMNSRLRKHMKKWPHRVEQDPRATIRIDGSMYEMNLRRLQYDSSADPVLERFNTKYRRDIKPDDLINGSSWLFELVPV